MTLVLRKITKSKWYAAPWLPAGDAPADALGSLGTRRNTLSIWMIEEDESDLERIVAAVAATGDHLAEFDFALLDRRSIEGLGILIHEVAGTSPDVEANARHADLVELSAGKVAGLARAIMANGDRRRFLGKQVLDLIRASIGAGRFTPESLKPDVRKYL